MEVPVVVKELILPKKSKCAYLFEDSQPSETISLTDCYEIRLAQTFL
jgi:hypothetical protein